MHRCASYILTAAVVALATAGGVLAAEDANKEHAELAKALAAVKVSLDSLEEKLGQFSSGTEFLVFASPTGSSRIDRARADLCAFLTARGMVVRTVTN